MTNSNDNFSDEMIHSRERELENKKDEKIIKIKENLFSEKVTNSNYKFLVQSYNKREKLTDKFNDLIEISRIFRDRNLLKETKYFNDVAEKLAKLIGKPVFKADSFHLKSLYLFKCLKMDAALKAIYKALNICKKDKCSDRLSVYYNTIGVIYSAIGLHKKSYDSFHKSLEYQPENVISLQNIAQQFVHEKKYDKAEKILLQSIELIKKQKKFFLLKQSYLNIAEVFTFQKKFKEAEDYYILTEKNIKEFPNERSEGLFWLGKGYLFLKKKEFEKAEKYFYKTKILAKKLKNFELQWFTVTCYKELYEERKDYKNLAKILKKQIKFKDKMHEGKIKQRINELETAYKIQEKELKAKEMIEKSSRLASIGVMAAGITHEINQPLNSISVNAQMLLFKNKNEKILPQTYIESIEEINTGVERINSIISHMRSFWNYPKYKKNDKIDLHKTIKSSVNLIKQQINSHGIKLELDFVKTKLYAKINKVHLEQIIINLIVNSIHSLDKIKNRKKIIKIKTKFKDEFCEIKVEDDGTGFSENEYEQIYEPFYSSKNPEEGMGLGLAIVHNYVTKMNGEIKHGNNKGFGAFFKIKIPICNEEK